MPIIPPDGRFQKEFLAFSFTFYEAESGEKLSADDHKSDKIFAPEYHKEYLLSLMNGDLPLFLNLRSKIGLEMCCSLKGFSKERRNIYIPNWMMEYFGLEEGTRIYLDSVTLPAGTKVGFKVPDEMKKFDDPEAVIADALMHRSALTVGQQIEVDYEPVGTYTITVEELDPSIAVHIVNCNMPISFT